MRTEMMYPNFEPGDMVCVSFDGGVTFIQQRRILTEEHAVRAMKQVNDHRGQEEQYKITHRTGGTKYE